MRIKNTFLPGKYMIITIRRHYGHRYSLRTEMTLIEQEHEDEQQRARGDVWSSAKAAEGDPCSDNTSPSVTLFYSCTTVVIREKEFRALCVSFSTARQ